jgi:uncharacterized protein
MTPFLASLPNRALIGMVHLPPLPGSPACRQGLPNILDTAQADAEKLAQAGFDALIVENFGDAPFRSGSVDPHTISCMTVIARQLAAVVPLPLGINVLRNDPIAALAIAHTCGAQFIRVNVHCGVYATDQGIIEGRADETLRYRQAIGCSASILADVHVKHASSMLQQPIEEAAEEVAYRGRADALIVSGSGTGKATAMNDLQAVRGAVPDRPLFVGSGVNTRTVQDVLRVADGVIVGTAIKENEYTTAPVDARRAEEFVKAAGR